MKCVQHAKLAAAEKANRDLQWQVAMLARLADPEAQTSDVRLLLQRHPDGEALKEAPGALRFTDCLGFRVQVQLCLRMNNAVY